jgi:hypothetical protein
MVVSKRFSGLVLTLLLALACGDEAVSSIDGGPGGTNDAGSGTINSPECNACASTLSSETNQCGATLDSCTNVVQETEAHVTCFRTEGQCMSGALLKAGSCHRDCGDEEQARVEECAAVCFTDRAGCAESAIRKADQCLDVCSGADCDLCKASGVLDFDRCNATATTCADTCVRTHRGG